MSAARWARLPLGLLVAGALLVACNGGDASPEATPSASPTPAAPAATEPAPAFDPGVTIEQAVQACREKDGNRLRSLIASRVTDEETERLFARGVDVRLLSRTLVDAAADTAVVDVTLSIDREGGTETVARSWQLERGDDGVWRFSELPDCY